MTQSTRLLPTPFPHELAVGLSSFVHVPCGDRDCKVARFAHSLASINIPSVRIKLRTILGLSASGALLTRRIPQMPILILCVLRRRIPAQILDSVVARVWVRMMATVVGRGRRRSDEREQNQPMDLRCDHSPINVELGNDIPIPAPVSLNLPRGAESASAAIVASFALEGPYGAIVPDKIVRESRYLSNLSFHSMCIHRATTEGNGTFAEPEC